MPRLADIRFRKQTAANWTSVNPTLNEGEPTIETDTGKMKVGTGAAYNATSYVGAGLAENATKWSGRALFVSSTAPTTGMVSGDIWIKI
jgi:hypothetical protein